MYTANDRETALAEIVAFINDCDVFESMMQIGSGALGYRDIYSDIDLFAGCYDAPSVTTARDALLAYFKGKHAVYISHRRWSDMCLGFSAFFENKLSIDISFSPTEEMLVCSPEWKIVSDKTGKLTEHITKDSEEFLRSYSSYGIDQSVNHEFIYALRKCEIAIKRDNLIYAEMALSEARKLVMDIQVLNEHKKLHQFKAYNTLNSDFLAAVHDTYPNSLTRDAFAGSKDRLLALFEQTINENSTLQFDANQLKLLEF